MLKTMWIKILSLNHLSVEVEVTSQMIYFSNSIYNTQQARLNFIRRIGNLKFNNTSYCLTYQLKTAHFAIRPKE